jgi:hypothetical protein
MLVTACGDGSNTRRDGEAKDFIAVQRTVSGESMATCLAREGFVFSGTYAGVQGTVQATYDKGKQESVTINVDRKSGIVAPWNKTDDATLLKYHCQPSDVPDNSPAPTTLPSHSHDPSATTMPMPS